MGPMSASTTPSTLSPTRRPITLRRARRIRSFAPSSRSPWTWCAGRCKSIDAVVCRWGLMFFHNPVGTLARLRNSLVPGRWLVVAVWGNPSQVPIISLPFSVFSRELSQPPSLPRGPNPFALSEPTRLEQALRDSGFVNVRCEPFTVTFAFASVDELLGHLGDVSAPIRMIMATLSPLDQPEFWKKLADAAAQFADADGGIRLPNACLVAAGQR